MRWTCLKERFLLVANLLAASVIAELDPIVIKGAKFFYQAGGTEFFIKGVAYQQIAPSGGEYSDPLADAAGCARDIPYITKLGMNTIHVYAIDPTESHDACMNAFADANIYVLADLSAPVDGAFIDGHSPTWNVEQYARYTSVIDALQGYTNTLGFFAGNEVFNHTGDTNAAPFVKAAVRDMREYINTKGYRALGVGYAMNHDPSIFNPASRFFDCGSQADVVDFLGLNIYSWCGDSTYTESGYQTLTTHFESYAVPSFFAEYGCNAIEPRPFTEVQTLYGTRMSKVFSGGIAYEYFQESNDFGLVSVNGSSVSTRQDYDNLQSQLAKVTPTGVNMNAYNPTNSPAKCPTLATTWSATASPLPPTPKRQLCECMYSSLACAVVPGTNEDTYESLLADVCSLDVDACTQIGSNGTTGEYGIYTACNSTEQLGFAFNRYYSSKNKSTKACDFNGAAQTQKPTQLSNTCQTLVDEAHTSTATPSASSTATFTGGSMSSSSASSGLATSAQVGIGVGVGVGCALLLAVGAYLLWRRHRRSRNASAQAIREKDETEMPQPAMLGNDGQRHEMEQPVSEMPTGGEAQELPARHGQAELGRSASSKLADGIESRHEMAADSTNST